MRKTLALAAVTVAALATSACITVIGTEETADYGWSGSGGQPFEAARDQCRERFGRAEGTTAFIQCMTEKGWTRTVD